MRIAVPLVDGKLSMHFGHCERFAMIDVDPAEKKVLAREDAEAPPPQPAAPPLKRQRVPFSETPTAPMLPRLIQEVGQHVSLGIVFAGQLTGWLLESWLPDRD